VDQALADAHQFASAGGVHRVAAGAVLPGHLPRARVHAQAAQGRGHDARHELEAGGDARARVGVGDRVAERQRALVEDRRPAARQALHGREAHRACGLHRRAVAGRHDVLLAEGNAAPRAGDPEGLGEGTRRHALEQRPGERCVERRVVREGVLDYVEGRAQ
jgi:hypothetical protein